MANILILFKKYPEEDFGFRKLGELSGQNITLSTYETLKFSIQGQNISAKIEDKEISEYDLVYIKNWGDALQPYATSIANYLSFTKTKFIEKAVSLPTTGNKLLQMIKLTMAGLPVPRTFFVQKNHWMESIEEIEQLFNYPFIFKATGASKGANNFLINSRTELESALEAGKSAPNFIVQEYIENSFDYRLVVMGDNVTVLIRRENTSDTHLNNISAGNREVILDPSEPQYQHLNGIAVKATKVFARSITGVDIIVDKDGNPYILEVNPSPGFTHDLDASPEFSELAKYLSSLVEENE